MNAAEHRLSRRDFLKFACAATAIPGISWGEPSGGYIDAHVHVWSADIGRYPLKPGFSKDQMKLPAFTPEDLFKHARPAGVNRIVLIQMSYYGYDNSYMLDVMKAHPGVFSGVAVIDPDDHPRETMLELAGRGVRGFRIAAGRSAPDQWLAGKGMAAMWQCGAEHRLAICPLINPIHLPSLGQMADKFPETPVVIDHLARIGADGQFRDSDIDALCSLRRHKNINVKVSAFSALGAKVAPYLDLAPLIRRVVNAFGPQRLMWATDGPWQMMGGHKYIDSIELIRSKLDFLNGRDKEWLLRNTAESVFFR